MKIETFKEKLGSWTDFLAPFIQSAKCDAIYKKLKQVSSKRKTIFPTSQDTYRAFNLCPPEKLRVILIGMEPYSGLYYDTKLPQADGLALSCSNGKIQPSLEYFLGGLAKEYQLGYKEYYETNDLAYLAEQGVLLTNRSLTVVHKEIGGMIGLWDDFWEFFFQELQSKHPNIPILFMGNDAAFLKRYVFELANPTWTLNHPSYAARIYEDWNTKGTFETINGYLRNHHDDAIVWSHKLYEEIKEELKSDDPEVVRIAKLKDDTLLPF